MSREERRQYQRMTRRSGGYNPYPTPPRRPGDRQKTRAAASGSRSTPDLGFSRRFWTWTLLAAAVAGLLLLSLSWQQVPAETSLLIGALGAAGWIGGAVGARLIRRRLAAR